MNKPILLVLAAGMGSRYGGLKQMDPMGPHGEGILDYSLYDARLSGFERVVFVVNRRIYSDFRAVIGTRAEKLMEVSYAFQELDDLPRGYSVPEGREKPWGTGHAVLCARQYLDSPFGVINADDFYGRGCFTRLYRFLQNDCDSQNMSLIGFLLGGTLSDNGGVSRGVCQVDNGLLSFIEEHKNVRRTDGRIIGDVADGQHILTEDTVVSMNVWGFHPSIFLYLGDQFTQFLSKLTNKQKDEYYIPLFAQWLLEQKKACFHVLPERAQWYGVTYREDCDMVKKALLRLHQSGEYPSSLLL